MDAGRQDQGRPLESDEREEPFMTTLTDRPATALLVVDMQRGVVGQAHDVERVTANIASLVERARSVSVPIIWVQHSSDDMPEGSEAWEYVDDIQRADAEPLVAKRYCDSFEETDLESVLAEHAVGRLIVTGAQTDACIRATLHGALVRGYDTTLVSDGHTTKDMRDWGSPISAEQAIAYANMYWSFSAAPGRTCSTVATADVQLLPD